MDYLFELLRQKRFYFLHFLLLMVTLWAMTAVFEVVIDTINIGDQDNETFFTPPPRLAVREYRYSLDKDRSEAMIHVGSGDLNDVIIVPNKKNKLNSYISLGSYHFSLSHFKEENNDQEILRIAPLSASECKELIRTKGKELLSDEELSKAYARQCSEQFLPALLFRKKDGALYRNERLLVKVPSFSGGKDRLLDLLRLPTIEDKDKVGVVTAVISQKEWQQLLLEGAEDNYQINLKKGKGAELLPITVEWDSKGTLSDDSRALSEAQENLDAVSRKIMNDFIFVRSPEQMARSTAHAAPGKKVFIRFRLPDRDLALVIGREKEGSRGRISIGDLFSHPQTQKAIDEKVLCERKNEGCHHVAFLMTLFPFYYDLRYPEFYDIKQKKDAFTVVLPYNQDRELEIKVNGAAGLPLGPFLPIPGEFSQVMYIKMPYDFAGVVAAGETDGSALRTAIDTAQWYTEALDPPQNSDQEEKTFSLPASLREEGPKPLELIVPKDTVTKNLRSAFALSLFMVLFIFSIFAGRVTERLPLEGGKGNNLNYLLFIYLLLFILFALSVPIQAVLQLTNVFLFDPLGYIKYEVEGILVPLVVISLFLYDLPLERSSTFSLHIKRFLPLLITAFLSFLAFGLSSSLFVTPLAAEEALRAAVLWTFLGSVAGYALLVLAFWSLVWLAEYFLRKTPSLNWYNTRQISNSLAIYLLDRWIPWVLVLVSLVLSVGLASLFKGVPLYSGIFVAFPLFVIGGWWLRSRRKKRGTIREIVFLFVLLLSSLMLFLILSNMPYERWLLDHPQVVFLIIMLVLLSGLGIVFLMLKDLSSCWGPRFVVLLISLVLLVVIFFKMPYEHWFLGYPQMVFLFSLLIFLSGVLLVLFMVKEAFCCWDQRKENPAIGCTHKCASSWWAFSYNRYWEVGGITASYIVLAFLAAIFGLVVLDEHNIELYFMVLLFLTMLLYYDSSMGINIQKEFVYRPELSKLFNLNALVSLILVLPLIRNPGEGYVFGFFFMVVHNMLMSSINFGSGEDKSMFLKRLFLQGFPVALIVLFILIRPCFIPKLYPYMDSASPYYGKIMRFMERNQLYESPFYMANNEQISNSLRSSIEDNRFPNESNAHTDLIFNSTTAIMHKLITTGGPTAERYKEMIWGSLLLLFFLFLMEFFNGRRNPIFLIVASYFLLRVLYIILYSYSAAPLTGINMPFVASGKGAMITNLMMLGLIIYFIGKKQLPRGRREG